jgi:hypothetical protein
MTNPPSVRRWVVAVAIAFTALGCGASNVGGEGLDTATLPSDVRADYAVFAHRCSKCHSLSRPLNSGITDDREWSMYVARMRRQPASGISEEDVTVILRFLHYYSLDRLRKNDKSGRLPGSAISEEIRRW